MKISNILALTGLILFHTACANSSSSKTNSEDQSSTKPAQAYSGKTEKATFALGCFWHSEEMFSELKGVIEAVPGYSGGTAPNPSYEDVCTGLTGHAESVDITYDPTIITYNQLLQVFFTEHDPTTPNYAAPDEGTQYRSVVFYRNDDQKQQAEKYIAQLNASNKYKNPIITQVVPFTKFYQAEDYHLHYYRKHPNQGYISSVTRPEIEKFRKDFKDWLK